MSSEFNEKHYSVKMNKSIQSFKKDISTLRTGRANINMLDTIKVDVYGQLMPIDQLATVSVPEARLISIQVWDKGNAQYHRLCNSKIRIRYQSPNRWTDHSTKNSRSHRKRRKELIKILKNMGEKSKISIRNIRREANEELKNNLKQKFISEDQSKNYEKNIQNLTDKSIEEIEKILTDKEKEISQI